MELRSRCTASALFVGLAVGITFLLVVPMAGPASAQTPQPTPTWTAAGCPPQSYSFQANTVVNSPGYLAHLKSHATWLGTTTGSCSNRSIVIGGNTKDALDCRTSMSTLQDDYAEDSWSDRLKRMFEAVHGATILGTFFDWNPVTPTTSAPKPVIYTARCAVNPALVEALNVPGLRPVYSSTRMVSTDGALQRDLSCSDRVPFQWPNSKTPSNSQYSYTPAYFSAISNDYAFGCFAAPFGTSEVGKSWKDCGTRLWFSRTSEDENTVVGISRIEIGYGGGVTINGQGKYTCTDSTGAELPNGWADVPTSPGECCTLPGFGTSDPPPDYADLTGCKGLTITSEDRSDSYYVEGEPLTYRLSPIDPARSPAGQAVKVTMTAGDPANNQVFNLVHPGTRDFVMPTPKKIGLAADEPRQLDYFTFYLQCADGSSSIRYYDRTGDGGTYSSEWPGDASGTLAQCLDDSSDLELDPSSWVPGLVDRLKCLAEWLVIPEHSMSYWSADLKAKYLDSAITDVADVALAPYRGLDAMADGASAETSLTIGSRTINLPAVPSLTALRISQAIGALVVIVVLYRIGRLFQTALRTPSAGDDE